MGTSVTPHWPLSRQLKDGLNHYEAFKIPAGSPIFVDGVQYPSVEEAAIKYGIHSATVGYRLKRGWNIDREFKIPTKN